MRESGRVGALLLQDGEKSGGIVLEKSEDAPAGVLDQSLHVPLREHQVVKPRSGVVPPPDANPLGGRTTSAAAPGAIRPPRGILVTLWIDAVGDDPRAVARQCVEAAEQTPGPRLRSDE